MSKINKLAVALAEVETLRFQLAEARQLQVQAHQVAVNRVRKQRVTGLGLVFGEGQPRMEFQDRLFEQNEAGWTTVLADGTKALVHLTDAQLVILNNVEHPMCSCEITLGIVRAMRRLYNVGKHSKAYGVPSVLSRPYSGDGLLMGVVETTDPYTADGEGAFASVDPAFELPGVTAEEFETAEEFAAAVNE